MSLCSFLELDVVLSEWLSENSTICSLLMSELVGTDSNSADLVLGGIKLGIEWEGEYSLE